MKKALIAGGIAAFLLIGAFTVLLAKASPDNAPQGVKVIELPDTFEK